MQPYKPTSRDFYEELEVLVMQKKQCRIAYQAPNGAVNTLNDRVYRLYKREDEEYLVLEKGLEIRLDYIISIDGMQLSHFC